MKLKGKQNVKLRSSSIKFQNYCKQLAVLFHIYTDFAFLKIEVRAIARSNNTSYTEKY